MLEIGFKTYYDRTVISAKRNGNESFAEKTAEKTAEKAVEKAAEKLLSYACELLLEEEADGRLKVIRSIVDDGYIYFEAEPFEFSKERFDGIIDAFSWALCAFSEEYPGDIRFE